MRIEDFEKLKKYIEKRPFHDIKIEIVVLNENVASAVVEDVKKMMKDEQIDASGVEITKIANNVYLIKIE